MSMIDVGELQKIRIGHDNKGIGAWFLDKVVIKKSNAETCGSLAKPVSRRTG